MKVVVLSVVLSLCCVASAFAAPKVSDLVASAETAYNDGRYEDAIARYLEAYTASHDPQILLIVAHIHDRTLGRAQMAAAYYRLYLATNPIDRGQVQGELAQAEAKTGAPSDQTVLEVTSAPEDRLTVRRDDGTVLRQATELEPGRVGLTVQKPEAGSKKLDLTLAPGRTRVHVVWPDAPARLTPPEQPGRSMEWALTGFTIGATAAWGTAATIAQIEQDHQVAVTADVLLGVAAVGAIFTVVAWVTE